MEYLTLEPNIEGSSDLQSDLWDKLEYYDDLKTEFENLRKQSTDPDISDSQRNRARQRLLQAEEVLLCQDTREHHAEPDRYNKLLSKLIEYHQRDSIRVPDIDACLS